MTNKRFRLDPIKKDAKKTRKDLKINQYLWMMVSGFEFLLFVLNHFWNFRFIVESVFALLLYIHLFYPCLFIWVINRVLLFGNWLFKMQENHLMSLGPFQPFLLCIVQRKNYLVHLFNITITIIIITNIIHIFNNRMDWTNLI